MLWYLGTDECVATSRSTTGTSFIPHSLFSFFFLLPRRSMLFLAGDLTQWHLPVGMKELDLYNTKVAGKTTSE